jgi:ATP-binding cassette subfamily F protein 2
LQCLASRELPIPEHIDIFHLDEEAEPSDRTALDAVVDVVKAKVDALEALAEHIVETAGPDAEIVQDIYERIDRLNPQTFEVRAIEILMGLGFSREFMAKKTKDLSGGWRMRVALSRALLSQPSMMLLDEPTNHLDMESCVWLETELAKYPGILVLVSHSQDFLNGVCTDMIHLTPKAKFLYYKGNYDAYVKTEQENNVNQMKRYEKEQSDIKHLKEFINSCGTYANLVKQAQSKQKIIDKMIDAGLTEKVETEKHIKFAFPDCGPLPPPVLAVDNVGFAYSGKTEDLLYNGLDLSVDLDSRIAIIGPNGAGKSTLLKLMFGELTPTTGEVKKHSHLRIAKYHQHSTDQLDLDMTPLEYMNSQFPEKKLEIEAWRGRVGRFGVSGGMQTQPIRGMSDGQKSRLVFAYIAECNPHILFLDEPTNHLDMESIDSLAEAINEFKGGLVLVSHDFRLIGKVATEVWLCENKKVDVWKGDILEYKKRLVKDVNRKLKEGLTTPQ